MSAHPATGRCQTPFPFPFASLGFSLFDTDPSRILTMLHHQTLLAEEALKGNISRYRGLLFTSQKEPARFNSISDILNSPSTLATTSTMKEQQQDSKRTNLYKSPNKNHNNNTNFVTTMSKSMNSNRLLTNSTITSNIAQTFNSNNFYKQNRQTASASPQYHKDTILDELRKRSEESVLREEEAEMELAMKKGSFNQFLHRNIGGGSTSSLTDSPNIRYNVASTETLSSSKEKSSSSSTSSTPPPPNKSTTSSSGIQSAVDSVIYSSSSSEQIEEETWCINCNAQFPNVWLLEQHAALQHAGGPDDKPFICEQCGQSYRYRSAYAKHKEQNHRARLPADKLFTCDVCGMQFRYLKSFKKHRLNHALERLHGKKDRRNLTGMNSGAVDSGINQDIVSSSNETLTKNEVADLRINIKREKDDDQDNTIDSACGLGIIGASNVNIAQHGESSGTQNLVNGEPKISSSEGIYSTNKRPRLFSLINEPETMQMQQVATTSINSLINAERIPSEQMLGLNPQEASILNFLRVDAAERQRDKKNPSSRFACPFCGKCVRSKENLKLHVRKHTGERPFVCLFCGRAFGGKSDLTRHLRIHTGERPYHCESCGKCFARADYLSKHLTTHIHNAPR